MDDDRLRPVVLALVAVVAIGLAAATLNSAVETDASGGIGPGSPGTAPGPGNDSGALPGLGNRTDLGAGTGGGPVVPCYPVLDRWWVLAALGGGFALGAALVYRRAGTAWAIAYVPPVGIPLLFARNVLTWCTRPASGAAGLSIAGGNRSSVPGGGGGVPGGASGTAVSAPSVLLLAALGVALFAAVALVLVSAGDRPDAGDDDEDPAATGDVTAVGRVAGEAADRIETGDDLDNGVYRAWREMTTHLDVARPASSTPAEFADAAVEAGMARADVEELTELFEAVRYGGEAPTDERERRAVEALRRIEREYAGTRPGDPGDGRRSTGEGKR